MSYKRLWIEVLKRAYRDLEECPKSKAKVCLRLDSQLCLESDWMKQIAEVVGVGYPKGWDIPCTHRKLLNVFRELQKIPGENPQGPSGRMRRSYPLLPGLLEVSEEGESPSSDHIPTF